MSDKYVILPDVTCDLSDEMRAQFGVDGYINSYMHTPDKGEVAGRLDLGDSEVDEFYADLKRHPSEYKTAVGSVEEIYQYFQTFLRQDLDIIALCISSRMSATYDVVVEAMNKALLDFPASKIFVVDSRRYSLGLGILALKACELRAQGYSIEQNMETIERVKSTIHQMGPIDDLFWVSSKGRISQSTAIFGSIAGIKPVGDFDSDGMVTVLGKVVGNKKAFKVTAEYVKETIVDAPGQTVFIAHSARRSQANILASNIEGIVGPRDIVICNIFPMSGINAGPGIVAAYYFGTEITDLEFEKSVAKKLLARKE